MESCILMGIAACTVCVACFRSLMLDDDASKNKNVQEALISVSSSQALLLPVFASCMLMLLFFFIASIGEVILCMSSISAMVAIGFTLYPLFNMIKSSCGVNTLLPVVSVLLVVGWLCTGWHVLNNVLGICSCIMAISFIRLPNTKIAVLLLFLLFLYDIFWVFYSAPLFGANVMVQVATASTGNPLAILNKFSLPWEIPPTLSLPAKLMIAKSAGNYSMLGLGDIAMPGLLLSLALRIDVQRSGVKYPGAAFVSSFAGYVVGLAMAWIAVVVYQVPQPALLYLVPCVVIPLHAAAWRYGFLNDLLFGQNSFIRSIKKSDSYNKDMNTGDVLLQEPLADDSQF